jgi:hypothetical protein
VVTAETGDGRLEAFLADPETAALDLTTAAARCTKALGLQHSVVCLADIQQRRLVPLGDITPPLLVDDSLAGWTYRTQPLRVEEPESGGMTAWVPLVDGAERLGVLAVQAPSLTPAVLRRGRALATLLAMMITSARAYQDSFVRRTRTNPMALPAEMLRAFLPPRAIGTGHVVSTAVPEPAYEIGGDAFDHPLTETTLHATVLDAMGHDLASGLTTAVSLAACRNARRTGADLPALVECVDDALARWLPDQFSARASWPSWTWPRGRCGGATAGIPPRCSSATSGCSSTRCGASRNRRWGCPRCSPGSSGGRTRSRCSRATGC